MRRLPASYVNAALGFKTYCQMCDGNRGFFHQWLVVKAVKFMEHLIVKLVCEIMLLEIVIIALLGNYKKSQFWVTTQNWDFLRDRRSQKLGQPGQYLVIITNGSEDVTLCSLYLLFNQCASFEPVLDCDFFNRP